MLRARARPLLAIMGLMAVAALVGTLASGSSPPVPSAPLVTLGPTIGSTVSQCEGIPVPAGADLARTARMHPPGTTYCLGAGVYSVEDFIPLEDGDQWVGALGSRGERLSILNGGDTTPRALVCRCSGGVVANVVLEHFANSIQQGPNGPAIVDWQYDNIESRENLGFGIHLHDGARLTNSYIHHNHQAGVGGQGDYVLVEGNEIAFNNYLAEVEPGFEAGGSKWVKTTNLTVRNNYVHDNCGPGLWTDGQNTGTVYEGNTVEDNWGAGIFHEISGSAIISNNLVNRNAFGEEGGVCAAEGGGGNGGIRISNSANVEVYGNTVAGNDGGISATEADRPSEFHVVGLNVHNNSVSFTLGFNGCQDTSGTGRCFDGGSNNRFEANKYRVGSDRDPFAWEGRERSWEEWQGFGHDETGSISYEH